MLLIFDFDGVLADTKKAWLYCLKKTLKEKALSFSYSEIETKLGPTSEGAISILLDKKPDDPTVLKLASKVDKRMVLEGLQFVKARKEAPAVLRTLSKNHKLALRTNSKKRFLMAIFKRFGISVHWEQMITGDLGLEKEKAVRTIIRTQNARLRDTVYTGDMDTDVRIGKKIGCTSVAIPGWHKASHLRKQRPDFLIRNLNELIEIVAKL